MSRPYVLTFEQVTVTAAQDLCTLPGPAAGQFRISRVWVGASDTTAPTNQQLAVRARFLPATVTLGTGGTGTITPSRVDPGDAACTVTTARTNDATTKATTSATAVTLYENGVNIFAGDNKSWPPGKGPIIGSGEALVWELLSTVTGTVHLSGGIEFEAVGG